MSRRLLIGAAVAAPVASVVTLRSDGRLWMAGALTAQPGLLAFADALQMRQPHFVDLAIKVIPAIDMHALERIVITSHSRLCESIGSVLASARATVPALIQDDYDQGRFAMVHGVSFAHIELALLFPLAASHLRPS